MCIACSPICGHCRPPTKKAVTCPECGTLSVFDIVVSADPPRRHCPKCGLDVTEFATPPIVFCKASGLMCANPCQRHTKAPEDGQLRVCHSNTPPPVPCAVAL